MALIVILGCVVASLAAGAGLGVVLSGKATAKPSQDNHAKAQKKAGPKSVHSLEELVVNLADTQVMRYAKVSVALGLEEHLAEEKLKEYEPLFRDTVIGVVTAKRFAQLHSRDGLPRLKEEIRTRLNERLNGVTVAEVYFEGFAMQ